MDRRAGSRVAHRLGSTKILIVVFHPIQTGLPMDSKKIGMIGLGQMGPAFTERLLESSRLCPSGTMGEQPARGVQPRHYQPPHASRAAGLDLPLSETHCRPLELAEETGYGEADNSTVIKAYEPVSGNGTDT